MLRNKHIVLMAVFFWFSLAAQVSAQFRWTTVNDQFGDTLLVKENTLTGAAHRVYGLGANISQYGTGVAELHHGNVDVAARKFLTDYKGIIKVLPDDLVLAKVDNGDGCWYVSYEQAHQGIRVIDTHVGFTIEKDGQIQVLGADVYPDIKKVNTTPLISEQQALETAQEDFISQGSEEAALAKDISILIYPESSNDHIDYYLVYKMQLLSTAPTKLWTYFIDAHTGEMVWSGSALRHGNWNNNGHVEMQYWPKYEGVNPTDDGSISEVQVKIYNLLSQQVAQGQTNSSGNYSINWTDAYSYYSLKGIKTLNLTGSYARIINADAKTEIHWFYPSSSHTHNWNWATDETNVYHHVNVMHDYWTGSPFNYSAMNYQMDAKVHDGGDKNGWSDGTDIGFGTWYSVNWARFSDAIYHEYTHCVVYNLYGGYFIDQDPPSPNSQSAAMDEAFPDYYACSKNGDPLVGDGITGVPGFPKDIGTDRVYPDDWVYNDPWLNGRIIAGACWDMRQDPDIGLVTANELVFDALKRTPHAWYFDDFALNVVAADQ